MTRPAFASIPCVLCLGLCLAAALAAGPATAPR